MIICICNNLAEEDIKKMSLEDYQKIKNCGICEETIKEMKGKQNMKKLIRSAIRTPDGTVLESRHSHDCRTHLDNNGETYMLDGGIDYQRGSINKEPAIDVSLYDDQPHEIQREVIKWGTCGKDGKQPLTLKPVSMMDTEHIELVLKECNPYKVYRDCMKKELEYRKKS